MTFDDSFLTSPWTFLNWLGTHLGDLGLCGLAVAAFLALSEYKKRVRFENQFDAAKRTLHVFYKFRDAIHKIRDPSQDAHELNELQARPDTNDFERAMKENTEAGITLLRIDKRQKYALAVEELMPEFRAFFGDDTSAFQGAKTIWNDILITTRLLTRPSELNKAKRAEYKNIICPPLDGDDHIAKQMDEIVQKIEDICLPVLRGETRT